MAGQEHFGIRLDTDKLEQDAAKAKKAFDGIAEQAVKAGETVDNSLGNGAQMAAGKFNTLNVSIQQIARELPSLTLSPQMFFLAISNNLPMFTDALASARKEYEAMTAAGQKGIPVWKQVAKSLVSWQTAISLLPTLLLLYGDNIVQFFEDIFTGSKKVDMAAESIKAFRETMLTGTQNAQKEITDIRLLYDATQDITEAVEDRKKAVDELQRLYPDYFGSLSDEEILAGKAADAYDRLTNSIIANAKAEASRKRITEEQTKVVDYGLKIDEAYAKLEPLEQKLKEAEGRLSAAQTAASMGAAGITTSGAKAIATSGNVAVQNAKSVRDELKSQVDDIYEEIEGYRAVIRQSEDISKQLENSIKITDLIDKETDKKGGNQQAVDNLKQYLNELLGLQEDNEERQIELTKSGTEKQIALIELRYQRQIEAVKKLQEELRKAQGGKLTGEQQSVFDTAISGLGTIKDREVGNVQNKQLEAERKAMQDYLAEYGDYWEKRKAIAEKYQDEIAKATTEGERKSLQSEMTEALAKLDDEAQKKTSIITKLFDSMADKTVKDMREIADEAENFLKFIKDGEYVSGNSFGITEEQFKVLSQSPEKLESIKNEIANVRAEADKAEPVFERIKNNLKDIFTKGADNKNLNKQLEQLNQDVNKVMQSVGFLADSFKKLGDAFGSDASSGVEDGLGAAMDAVSSAMQGAQAAGSLGLGGIGMAAGAAIGLVTSLASSIAKIHDAKKEKQIQKLQDQIDTLSAGYEKLGREAEKAFSTDASNLIGQQNKLLEQQKILIQQQIAEEKDKKKTDDERIKEWKQQLEDIDAQLEENKEAAIDAVTGTDLMSAIDQFAQAYADAWANGTDAAKASTDAVKSLIKTSLIEYLKKQLSPEVEEFMNNLANYMADGIISPWEQAQLDRLQQEMDDVANNYFNQVGDYFKEDTTSTQTASARGFETMSQDTANELNGRFTALYESNLRLETQINIGNVELGNIRNIATETRDIAQNCYFELVEIRENTGAIVKPIQQIQKDIEQVKQNTSKL